MEKTTRLGADPLEWIKDTREEAEKGKRTSKPERQKNIKTGSQEAGKPPKKATYYIRPELIKGLKYLGADTERDLSDLVNEAIEDFPNKHAMTTIKRTWKERKKTELENKTG